jgi:hypothetical protein
MTPERWLQVQFQKKLRRGYRDNAELSPPADEQVLRSVEAGEALLVKIVINSRKRYWLTDRRMLVHSDEGVSALFGYGDLLRVHWMSRDPLRRAFDSPRPDEEIARMKSKHGDRLELELTTGDVVLEHLGPAYNLVFEFLHFLIKTGRASATT